MSYRDQFGKIESEMQAFWEAEHVNAFTSKSTTGSKRYVLGMFPYPSGNAHLGHIFVYTIADVLARLGRFKGLDVLNPIGWDAFGLPAENAAIKNNVHPAAWTEANIAAMRGPQIGKGGFSFTDLEAELNTADPNYYKWTQWLFLKLKEHGQVYRAKSWVNWDPVDKTVLANEQVIDGKGWRSGAEIERREMEQWCFRITSFAQDLWDGLDELEGWSDRAKAAQRNWIGRSEGCEVYFEVVGGSAESVSVFTTRPDTLYGVTSLTLAPEHPLVKTLVAEDKKASALAYVEQAILKSDVERQSDTQKTGIAIGRNAINPLTGEEIPIYISDYVLHNYGTGAIMNVPAHDQRDFEFAKANGLHIKTVIQPPEGVEVNADEAYGDDGIMVDSGPFTGQNNRDALQKIADHVEEQGVGKRVVQFKLRDWSVARQRFWGAPIPMIHREDGEWETVPLEDLPVRLPEQVDFEEAGGKSPLAANPSFYETVAPSDGSPARREVDTMDTFMCSAWYAWRFLDPSNGDAPFTPEKAAKWMPIDYYVGGLEHANQHLIYFRYISHFLHSIGYTPTKEPVLNFLDNGMIQKDGFKMSKSRGNVIRPDDAFTEFGADALRLYLMSDTPFARDREWEDGGLSGKHRFLSSVSSMYQNAGEKFDLSRETSPPAVNDDLSVNLLSELYEMVSDAEVQIEERQAFHVVVAKIHGFANTLKSAINGAETPEQIKTVSFAMLSFLKVLGLYCPHIADHLWRTVFASKTSLFREAWPEVDQAVLSAKASMTDIILSVDGKRRKSLSVPVDASDENLEQLARETSAEMPQIFETRSIVKIIVVRGGEREPKLLNIVTKPAAK